jgi:3-deoxy-D-manno-octulosonate 8-phosphate phosphatase (KDO 8-P phosphatase)
MVKNPERLQKKLAKIKLLAVDVDGVLTDGGMYYSEHGDELKKFNTRDGKGIELLRNVGIKIAFITSENTRLVERRATKLKIDELCQGIKDKLVALRKITSKYNLTLDEVAYIGDDINDLAIMQAVGLAITVADGLPENKQIAQYITQAKGGEGAVREVATLILGARSALTSLKLRNGRR